MPPSSGRRRCCGPGRAGRRCRRRRRAGRPVAADVHLLPPGAGLRGPGRAHPAHPRRPDHGGDRPGVPGVEDTMSKRLVRAKRKIRHAGIPFRVPPAHLLRERTVSVLGVLYLLFNEGYAASAGADLVRQNLTAEAIRLARVLAQMLPDEPEVGGLLALLLLHDARRPPGSTRPGSWSPRGPGPEPLGREPDRRGHAAAGGGAAAGAAWPVPGPGGDRRLPRDRGRGRRHRLGRRSPRCTGSWHGWCPPRWCG